MSQTASSMLIWIYDNVMATEFCFRKYHNGLLLKPKLANLLKLNLTKNTWETRIQVYQRSKMCPGMIPSNSITWWGNHFSDHFPSFPYQGFLDYSINLFTKFRNTMISNVTYNYLRISYFLSCIMLPIFLHKLCNRFGNSAIRSESVKQTLTALKTLKALKTWKGLKTLKALNKRKKNKYCLMLFALQTVSTLAQHSTDIRFAHKGRLTSNLYSLNRPEYK